MLPYVAKIPELTELFKKAKNPLIMSKVMFDRSSV